MGKRWLYLLYLLLVPICVQAIGITPSRISVDFEANALQNFTVSILNSGKRDANVTVSFDGDLAEYIHADNAYFVVPTGGSHPFSFELRLPATIRKPGSHLIRILAVEAPLGERSGIIALTGVAGELRVFVPYTGKYVEFGMTAANVNTGEPVIFKLILHNLGEEAIISAVPTLTIFDDKKQIIETIVVPSTPIGALLTEEVHVPFATQGVKPGAFTATGILEYDGIFSDAVQTNFRIGTLSVALINYTREFAPEKVNKFELQIASQWNSNINNIFGEISMLKNNVSVGPLLRTPSVPLAPWEQKTVTTFWDTKGLEPGSYTAEITLHYHNKTTQQRVKVHIVDTFEITLTMVLTTVIVLILLIDFLLWLYHRRKDDEAK